MIIFTLPLAGVVQVEKIILNFCWFFPDWDYLTLQTLNAYRRIGGLKDTMNILGFIAE